MLLSSDESLAGWGQSALAKLFARKSAAPGPVAKAGAAVGGRPVLIGKRVFAPFGRFGLKAIRKG